ncbi:MAG: Stp1/IreP family PP2C-type Ser/Thr phosphatase [Actinobacteria bacterium]|nr:Stp1/IreP family PP2C-type Ser/Thr phosphatase [Actinomycetota bacterium]
MITYDAVAVTDTGQVRQANEDAYFLGDSVFAVADGMGGHVAGEIASRTALEPVAVIDGRVFADYDEAADSLTDALKDANGAVVARAIEEPELKGMGTTLTAALVEGRRLHIAHVGDSRAYLIRGGTIVRITKDHTLVQHFIDQGEITEEEAARHPQRSIITRAIGVSPLVEVDHHVVDLEVGDHVLLCSDGLTGQVEDGEIRETILTAEAEEAALDELVRLANERGGPDNITAVLLRIDEEGAANAAGSSQRQVIRTIDTDADTLDEDDWAGKLRRIGTIGKVEQVATPETETRGPSRRQRIAAIVVVSAIVLAAAGFGGRWLLARSFYVGVDEGQVVIYRGVPSSVGPFELSWIEERTELELADVAQFKRDDLEAGIAATSLADARLIVDNVPLTAGARAVTSDDPDAREGSSPDTTPTGTTSPDAGPIGDS